MPAESRRNWRPSLFNRAYGTQRLPRSITPTSPSAFDFPSLNDASPGLLTPDSNGSCTPTNTCAQRYYNGDFFPNRDASRSRRPMTSRILSSIQEAFPSAVRTTSITSIADALPTSANTQRYELSRNGSGVGLATPGLSTPYTPSDGLGGSIFGVGYATTPEIVVEDGDGMMRGRSLSRSSLTSALRRLGTFRGMAPRTPMESPMETPTERD